MESSVIQSSAVEQRVRQVHLGTQRAALRLLGDATAGRRLGGPLTRPVQIGVAEVCAAEVEAGQPAAAEVGELRARRDQAEALLPRPVPTAAEAWPSFSPDKRRGTEVVRSLNGTHWYDRWAAAAAAAAAAADPEPCPEAGVAGAPAAAGKEGRPGAVGVRLAAWP